MSTLNLQWNSTSLIIGLAVIMLACYVLTLLVRLMMTGTPCISSVNILLNNIRTSLTLLFNHLFYFYLTFNRTIVLSISKGLFMFLVALVLYYCVLYILGELPVCHCAAPNNPNLPMGNAPIGNAGGGNNMPVPDRMARFVGDGWELSKSAWPYVKPMLQYGSSIWAGHATGVKFVSYAPHLPGQGKSMLYGAGFVTGTFTAVFTHKVVDGPN